MSQVFLPCVAGPLASAGGVQPSFFAPLLTTLVPTTAGNPVYTYSRATAAFVADHEQILRQVQSGAARFQGARRVRNLVIPKSDDNTTNTINAGVTLTTTTIDFTIADSLSYKPNTAVQIPIGSRVTFSVVLSSANKATARLRAAGSGAFQIGAVTCPLTTTPTRFVVSGIMAATDFVQVGIDNRASVGGDGLLGLVTAVNWQLEVVDGQSNQAPGEYVSVGVASSPWHGCGVDGVRCFLTTNGNSVAGNIVTEATGTLIPLATTLGYVAENSATNTLTQSQTFDDAAWTKADAPVTANDAAAPAPDGTITADRFTDNATNSFHRFFRTGTLFTNAAVNTFSVYLKAGTLTWAQVYANEGTNRWANFNLQTGVLGLVAAGTTAAIVVLPNGWYRCSITWTAAAAFGELAIHSLNANVNGAAWTTGFYVGTGQTMYLWGAQVEQASDPSSYVPTTTVAVTRNVDWLGYPETANFSPAYALGSCYAEVYTTAEASGDYQMWVRTSSSQGPFVYLNVAPPKKLSAYPPSFVNTVNNRVMGAVNKGGYAWSGTTSSLCLNGGPIATSSAFTPFSGTGNFAVGGSGAQYAIQGSIRNLKFYNVRIADADLITMTA